MGMRFYQREGRGMVVNELVRNSVGPQHDVKDIE